MLGHCSAVFNSLGTCAYDILTYLGVEAKDAAKTSHNREFSLHQIILQSKKINSTEVEKLSKEMKSHYLWKSGDLVLLGESSVSAVLVVSAAS